MYPFTPDPTEVTGRRIGAWILDLVFAGVLATIAFAATVDIYQAGRGNPCFEPSRPSAEQVPICRGDFDGQAGWFVYDEGTDESVFFAGPLWLPVAVFAGYGAVSFVLVEGVAGGSLGKLIVGLRVVTAEGRRAGPGRAALRFLCWSVDGFPWCFPLVGLITGLTTRGHRRVGDLAAQTFVVSAADVGQPVTIPGLNAPAAAAYAAPVHPGPGAPWGAPPGAGPWGAPTGPAPWGPPAGSAPWGTPPGAGPAPPPGAWPATPDPAAADPGTADPAAVHPTEPQWDAERDTYIQWDVHRQQWLQWDVDANQWRPIG